ncbi:MULTISPECIES: ATP-binding cassette domain-containing protein [unclassified Sphingomonas]|uniref:ATP-binding cassette domain-containing protein n=1 Tax=unclassified Sphingomonas TaxID=196159 RepID=UPI00092CB9DC|nr:MULTISPECIES: ATP-binding cassette domain-containing protein [unclassified Sphingomonas]MBN8846715.1 ATP-binding cassette domain-containing protein [Sphingomonas sp.]OJV32526.1 MAG: molybdenum ABC transporter ATP-binding protein [Sphingomonas sp. 67-36]
MSFDVDVTLRRGGAMVGVAFAAEERAVALVGPSGVGKTSVLDMIAGLLRPDRGHVRVNGRTLVDRAARVEVPPHRRRAGYVFQDARLFPHLDVRRNLLYGARHEARLAPIAESLDIAHLLDRWPRALSGGEARRVAIGRALLSEPDFLLLDEPLSSLDPARREEAMRLIERVRDKTALPLLLVTHDEAEAKRLCARIVRM